MAGNHAVTDIILIINSFVNLKLLLFQQALDKGFAYLVAIMDIYSRKVLTWKISTTLDSEFCIAAVKEALAKYGTPAIFNTEKGCQFTSYAFLKPLHEAGVRISMDGQGSWRDNIYVERLWRSLKYEDIYLRSYENVREL